MPVLQECIRTGWQATVPMVTRPADLRVPFKSRYGRGVQTIFYAGNSAPVSVKGELLFDNAALDGKSRTYLYLRHSRENSATLNRIEKNFTAVSATIPSRTPELFRAVAGIDAPEKLLVDVSAVRQLHKRTITLTFKGTGFTSAVEVRKLRGFKNAEITLDGKKVRENQKLAFKDGS